jgi:hypothetical protein
MGFFARGTVGKGEKKIVYKVRKRIWREFVARVPPVGSAVQRRYQSRLLEHAPHLKPLPSPQQQLVRAVARSGVAICDLDAIGLSGTTELKASATRLAATLRRNLEPSSWDDLTEPDVWRWGLREDVLDLVESYLGLPPRYIGAQVRRESADGQRYDARHWHRDIEDHRMLKIFIWLENVGPGDGALEWIPSWLTDDITSELHYVSGMRTDQELARWPQYSAEGPRWTAVLADTRNVFHRAGLPHHRDRYSLMFGWTSRDPISIYNPGERVSVEQASQFTCGLSARQRACLPLKIARAGADRQHHARARASGP